MASHARVLALRRPFTTAMLSPAASFRARSTLHRVAPRRTAIPPVQRAWESGSVQVAPEEKDSGHIAVDSNESVLFFDNLFPLKLSPVLAWPWRTDRDLTDLVRRFENSSLGIMDPIRLVKNSIPDDMQMKVTEILPRLKDGGAFVKFRHDAAVDPATIEGQLVDRLKQSPLKPWFSPFRGISARLVQGTPWLEDLYRFPSSLVKVEFVPPEPGSIPEELSEETLYSLFRKYGKIADIMPQPVDSKVTPRYAHVMFPLTRDAIMSRNCMHGFIVGEAMGGGKAGTRLRISYEKRVKAHSIWNWLQNHPRIVIPIVAALLAGISVVIFDPIRQFFIKLHVQHSLRFTESRVYKWFKSQTGNFSFSRKKEQGDETVWNHRRELIQQLQDWVTESSDTFIVVTGPKGSGKSEMVMDQALEGRKNVLHFDCKPIVEARGEAGTIRRLATAVGYRPVFSWANSMSSMIDLAVQSTTGVKAGFSETLDSQLSKILHTTGSALKEVALEGRTKHDADANLSDDAFLESHPERRPVVVVDNFMHKNDDKALINDKIAEWAASIVQNNVAHVIFLTNDASLKPLTKALPDRVFRSLSLGDLDPEVAKNFVMSRLKEEQKNVEKEQKEDGEKNPKPFKMPDLKGLDEGIETLGGRLTDLEFLARRLKTGQSPKQAVDEIVDESATDIVKMFLLGKVGETEKTWSKQQAWHLIKSLAQNPTLRYNQVLLSPNFSSSLSKSASDGEAAIEALASAELVSVTYHQGRPQTIRAGKPLHQAAFKVLQKDRVLRAKMDLAVLTEQAKVEGKSLETVENELALLGSLPSQTAETGERVRHLLGKLMGSQRNIVKLETEMAGLKKVLNEEF
ncbi:hypothetical protein CC79DRAFT_1335983 [Sarocladium strictum]